jgi:hypothetical protein
MTVTLALVNRNFLLRSQGNRVLVAQIPMAGQARSVGGWHPCVDQKPTSVT